MIRFSDENVTLHHGDSLEVLAGLPEASVDAVVTDPPYELGFMGKAWDASGIAYSVDLWREVLRVLKPGGHLLSFGGTRTWHRMVCAIEDAGFEIRDELVWLYGSGFPKSLDVSKAIDKAGGEERQRVFRDELADAIRRSGLTFADIDRHLGVKATSCYWVRRDHRACLPAPHHWIRLGDLLPLSSDLRALYVEAERLDRVVSNGRPSGSLSGPAVSVIHPGTPATPAAEQWNGWGTALKPAHEPICLARKPLAGTVAANVLAHGVGALNIDACRVESGEALVRPAIARTDNDVLGSGLGAGVQVEPSGRWPANVVLDDEAARLLDQQSGTLTSGKMLPTHTTAGVDGRGTYGADAAGGFTMMETYGDSGGASRFFYVAKAAKHERPRLDDGTAHATVKPVALMRWLVRLITPPGGLVLDPFAGSGTTAEACIVEGFRCVLIEKDADHLPLIEARLSKPIAPTLFGGAS